MNLQPPFVVWFEEATGVVPADSLHLVDAFAIAVCRIEDASKMNARDPVRAVSNSGSECSRAATKSMLAQLGYSAAQVRIMQRLLAGSTGGWPGMIRLYLDRSSLTRDQRAYLRRQLRDFAAAAANAA